MPYFCRVMDAISHSIDVGILGATGVVGQQFVSRLARHPWFRPSWLAASERSEGKAYAAVAPWRLAAPIPDSLANTTVEPCVPGRGPRIVFSALDASVAGEIEQAFAAAGHIVVSNARNYRMDPLVPLLIPEVNADHLTVVPEQQTHEGLDGRDRHQSQLLDDRARDGARAAAAVRPEDGARLDDAGGVGRGLSGRRRRSTSSATSCRSSAAKKRRWRARR